MGMGAAHSRASNALWARRSRKAERGYVVLHYRARADRDLPATILHQRVDWQQPRPSWKRSIGLKWTLAAGNIGSLIGTNILPIKESPR
ncbi:uncharacterized protein CC84DRAFT_1165423 [Paraphaeosphaeria sporulosa]|uniref:Uncharacterized protein n=1 Tax=Paraphaeosphaeria sporulosa TaxID=1460663 RepID=A0A177CBM4_9PLEO|nr:uncharacterized protein CC84DRAFT_1165423 [Paraphaeosphaeria sporulosa]OAG05093.1 hypothetical protein CC84DRAFT_1165423 [Paraphaeosphaeria sporulosa]